MTDAMTAERTALITAIHAATAAMLPDNASTRFQKAMDRLGHLLAARDFERRYNPDWASQPRVPGGNPDGGRWTDGGRADEGVPPSHVSQLSIEPYSDEYLRCLDRCYPLLERYQGAGSDRNKWDFHRCMSTCLGQRLDA